MINNYKDNSVHRKIVILISYWRTLKYDKMLIQCEPCMENLSLEIDPGQSKIMYCDLYPNFPNGTVKIYSRFFPPLRMLVCFRTSSWQCCHMATNCNPLNMGAKSNFSHNCDNLLAFGPIFQEK